MSTETLFSLAEVGRCLGGLSVKSVRRIIAKGELKPVRILSKLMVPTSDISAYIEQLKQNRKDKAV